MLFTSASLAEADIAANSRAVSISWLESQVLEQIEAELQSLSPADLKRVRDWLDDFVEDRLEFREDFGAAIQESEREMGAGQRPRARKP